MLTACVFTGLLVFHILGYDGSFGEMFDTMYPKFTLFSSISKNLSTVYAGTIQGFIVISIFFTLSRWTRFFEEKTAQQLYDESLSQYSKLLFNCWNWNLSTPEECENAKVSVCNELKLVLFEANVKALIEKRTIAETVSLYIRRGILICVNIVILAFGWAGIAAIYIYEREMIQFTESIFIINYIVFFHDYTIKVTIHTRICACFSKLSYSDNKYKIHQLRKLGICIYASKKRNLETIYDNYSQYCYNLCPICRILIQENLFLLLHNY